VKPYYDDGKGIVIYHGDCREIMPHVFDKAEWIIGRTPDVIVCDPPYGLGIQFGRRDETVVGDEGVYLRNWICSFPRPKLLFGSPKVERPAGVRLTLIWDKSGLAGMGDLDFPWKLTHEEIYAIGEGFKSRRRRGSVLRHPLRPCWSNHTDAVTGEHPAEKPVPLLVDLLECCPWERVIDPTCGTGPTLQAAKQLNKQAIGIEIEEKYCEIAAKRLSQEVLEFR
jgi:site-specific DNA-methyltransferase (adenine-specific)